MPASHGAAQHHHARPPTPPSAAEHPDIVMTRTADEGFLQRWAEGAPRHTGAHRSRHSLLAGGWGCGCVGLGENGQTERHPAG